MTAAPDDEVLYSGPALVIRHRYLDDVFLQPGASSSTKRRGDEFVDDLRRRLTSSLAGRYAVQEELGRGGMAVVFLAKDLKHQRDVAIKVLRPELEQSLGVPRFRREIGIVSKMSHPHILPLYDSGETDGLHYLVMPFVPDDSLRDRLEAQGTLPLDEAVRITAQIADALQYAHDRELVHRDVKPANILFQSGHAALTDFGIARGLESGEVTRLTRAGTSLGTVAYMSPEQAAGDAVDGRTDVYALACILFEMLQGSAAFPGRSPQAVLASKLSGTVPTLHGSRDVPPTVSAVIEMALAPSAEDRCDTPRAFATALKVAVTGEAIEADRRRRRRRRWLRRSGIAAGVASIGLSGWLLSVQVVGPDVERVAVLPFQVDPLRGAEPEDETSVLEGMHDALIAEMQQAGLEVIGRRSVLRYQGDDVTPIREIAAELNVDAVVESLAFFSSDSAGLRLTMTDGETETALWTASFGTAARNVVGLYRQATRGIAEAAGFELGADVLARLAQAQVVDPLAYEAHLQGLYHWYRLTPQDLDLAEQYFLQALRIDPDYAPALTGVAILWAGRQQFGLAPPDVAGPRAREAVQRAMELDASLAEVHLADAAVKTWVDWDWTGGLRAFERAIEINPSFWEARAYFAHLLVFMDRPDEALDQAAQAAAGDPLNSLVIALSCVTSSLLDRFEESLALCQESLRLDPTQPVAHDGMSQSLRGLGRFDEAVEYEVGLLRAMGDTELASVMEAGLADGGLPEAMRRTSEVFLQRAERGFVQPFRVASALFEGGDLDGAIEWFLRAHALRDPAIPYAMAVPWPPALANDPRFLAIREDVGVKR